MEDLIEIVRGFGAIIVAANLTFLLANLKQPYDRGYHDFSRKEFSQGLFSRFWYLTTLPARYFSMWNLRD